MADAACVVGRLPGDGPLVGFARDGAGYHLSIADGGGPQRLAVERDVLLAVAILHFAETLAGPSPEDEATQQDLAELVSWLLEQEQRPHAKAPLREALDGIDDGLAGDVLVARLQAALDASAGTRLDPLDLVTRAGRARR